MARRLLRSPLLSSIQSERQIMQTQAVHRARGLAAASFLLVGLAIANWPAQAQSGNSKGLYSDNANNSAGVTGPITQTVR
jgi:hypothetical protein